MIIRKSKQLQTFVASAGEKKENIENKDEDEDEDASDIEF
jgi:hypothetical protein